MIRVFSGVKGNKNEKKQLNKCNPLITKEQHFS